MDTLSVIGPETRCVSVSVGLTDCTIVKHLHGGHCVMEMSTVSSTFFSNRLIKKLRSKVYTVYLESVE